MARTHETLTNLFQDTAKAIRSKTGGTTIIVADNFPTEINNIVVAKYAYAAFYDNTRAIAILPYSTESISETTLSLPAGAASYDSSTQTLTFN